MKIAGDKLHLFMIDLDKLEDARPILILLELVHDLIILPENYEMEHFKKVMSESFREECI